MPQSADPNPKIDESSDTYALDDPAIWSSRWFQEKLIKGLSNEGFDGDAIQNFGEFLLNSKIATFEDYCAKIEAQIAKETATAARALTDIHEHIQSVKGYNETVYTPKTLRDWRVRYWPNNPKLLQTQWDAYEDIFEANFCLEPNRFITSDTTIASAGSCFAQNISRQLQYWGYNYKIEMGKTPDTIEDPLHYESDPAQCGNIYNSQSMRAMLERAFGEREPEKIALWQYPRVIEAFRGRSNATELEEYFNGEWTEHNRSLKRAMENCEVFILTLGNTEIWTFADDDRPLALSPRNCDATLMRLKNQTLDETCADLEAFYKLFKKHNPNVKIIATVSPVPLNATFNNDRHVVVANSLSKSTLRVALEYFCNDHPEDVFYFPAYEIVTSGCRTPWKTDMRHVSDEAIDKVMKAFQWTFMEDQTPMPTIWEPEIESYIDTRRNYFLRYARKWVVHPLKRKLGIYGHPFSDLWRAKKK